MKPFPANARVCFLGDSITANGRYVALIADCYKKLFPDSGIRFFDCGTSGAGTKWLLDTFETDIASHKPTHVYITIGINDSWRDHLSHPRDAERYQVLLERYRNWEKNYREIIRRCRELGAEITLVSLPPYAEYQPGDSPVLPGAYALTVGYAAATKALALEYGCGFADLHAYMTEKMQTESIYAEDRVHPTPRGHLYMAEAILNSQGLAPVSGEEDAHICALQEKIAEYRRIAATEYLVINDESLSTQEKLSAAKKYLEEERWAQPNAMNFREIAELYLEIKPHQAELAAELDALLTA